MRRRITAVTVLLLMLHLTTLGSGVTWAASPECDDAQAMAGMVMDDAPDAAAPGHPAQPSESPDDACNLPWAAGCTSAAACGPTAAVTPIFVREGRPVPPPGIVALASGMPRSLTIAPELPPPRG